MFEERGVQDCAKYQHKIRKLLDYVDEFLNVETMMNYKTWSSLPCFMFCVFDVFLSMIHHNSLIAYVSESKGTSKKIWSNAISSGRRKRETLMGMCRPFFRPTLVASWIASQRGGANIDGAVPAEAMKPVEASPKDSCTPGTFDRVVISCKIFHGFGGLILQESFLSTRKDNGEYLNPDHTGLYARCAWEYRLESIYICTSVIFFRVIMYTMYGNIYHQYTPNVSIYTIHGSYGL